MNEDLVHRDMDAREPRMTCLFCGKEFDDAADLFNHSGRVHLRTRDEF